MSSLEDIARQEAFQKALAGLNPEPQPQLASQSTLALLGAFAGALQITKCREYFVNQRVTLDGIYFEACRFDNCILTTSTGDVHLSNCVFGPGTSLQLGGQLVSVAKLLSVFNRFPNEWLPRITPFGNNVYGISIP